MNDPSQLHAKVLTMISHLMQELKTMMELSPLYLKMLNLLRDEAGYQNSTLLLSNGNGHLDEAAVLGYRTNEKRRKYPLPYECLAGGNVGDDVFLVNDVETVPTAKQGSSVGKGSLLAVLLRSVPLPSISDQDSNESKITGAILLEDERTNAFSAMDCQLMQTVAPFFATMIEMARHYKKIRDLALYDELTGLHNRRFLREYLDMEFSRAIRGNLTFSLAIIDLDSLKRVNDVYGHLIGDKVLKIAADVLSRNIRSYDVLARYAGDEFILAMQDTTLS